MKGTSFRNLKTATRRHAMKKLLTLLLSAAFVLGMYLPAAAAEWDFYGNARVSTFYTDYDDGLGDTTELTHELQGNARVGSHVTTDYVDANFEVDAAADDVRIRHLYGTFALGEGEMLVGQTWTPLAQPALNVGGQVYADDNAMDEFLGTNYRKAQVAYSIEGFTFALVEPVVAGTYETEEVIGEDGGDNDVVAPATEEIDPEVQLPQISAAYQMDMDGQNFGIAGAFQTYDIDSGDGDSLDSYTISGFYHNYMYDPVYFQVGGFYGQNARNMGVYGGLVDEAAGLSYAEVDDEGNVNEDADSFGFAGAVGTDLNGIGVEAGVGFRNDEVGDAEVDTLGTYAQANIPVTADGSAFIVPELGYYNYDHDDDDEDVIYGGLKFQANF